MRLPACVASRASLRLKLTLAFALVSAVLLASLGCFVYARFQAGLDQSLNDGLSARASDVRALALQADTGLAEAGRFRLASAEAGFAQVLLEPGGRVLDQTLGIARGALLSPAQLARASRRATFFTRMVAGVSAPSRLLATPIRAQGRSLIVITGVSLSARATALSDLRAVMVLGGPVALLLAALLGYGISASALGTVESMRRKAGALSVADPGGRLPVPTARDELQRLATTLNEMLDRNEASFARERRFIADASHELRSPIAVLRAELELALTGETSERDMRAALEAAYVEADRVTLMAGDLLTLSLADDGSLPIEPVELDAAVLARPLIARFLARAESEGRAIEASIDAGVRIWGDPLRLEQALGNLIDNGLRHGAGTITISARRLELTSELHVVDSGAGFPTGFLAGAFERFSRGARGRSSEGTGLGLSIVKSIAEAHGGQAHARNLAGAGADVWIELPCHAEAACSIRPSKPGRLSAA
jgi:signal transduction histidine kinase